MRTRLVAVVGSGGRLTEEVQRLSEELGAALMRAKFGLVTGGMAGVMEAVSRGAFQARGTSGNPPIVGILPGYDPDAGNGFLDVAIPTGLSHARNAVVASAGDAVICIGGATGALSEVALASKIGRPVLAFPETGGTAKLTAKSLKSVVEVKTVEQAIAQIQGLLA
ncbi:MAG: TIGR00725 family protein [Planctomycetota bacterium]|jgi:hypothetical protein|nr:TIGR00725 family protein [Planctomycetota bacterium]